METNVDQSGNAHLKVSKGSLQTLLKFWPDQRITIEKYNGSSWSSSGELLGNADIASKSTNLTPGGGYTVLSWFGCFAVISGGSCYLQIGLTSTTPTITSSKSIICALPTQYRPVRKYIQHTDWGDFVVDTDGTIYIGNTTSSLLHNKNITINAAFLT